MTTPPLSRRQTFHRSLSDHAKTSLPSLARSSTMLFNTKKAIWSDPEKSVGRPCELKFKGTECWEVIGTALDVFNKVAPDIEKLLVDNQELLEQGEAKPRVVAFHMWMVGSKPSSAQPVIVFSSKSRRQRLYAKTLLEQSGLLKAYSGISIKTLDKMPAVHQAAVKHLDFPLRSQSGLDVFMTDLSSEPFGAQISFGDSKIATMLGLVTLNGKRHALIPQHPRFDYHDDDLETLPTKDHLLEFDEDSDADDYDLVEITSAASVTPSPSETDDTSFQQSDEDSIFEAAYPTTSTPATSAPSSCRTSIRGSIAFSEAEWSALHAPHEEHSKRVKVATLPPDDTVNDLDYECVPVDDVEYQKPNRIVLPTTTDESPQFLFPRAVASRVEESPVWAVTGTTGLVKGTIIRNPYYIRMHGSHTCQEMWPVRLERDTMPGDCGSWVVNADTGDIYGHIVAGDPVSGMAYVIPAYKVFADIERRLGARPSLWTGEVNVQIAEADSIALSEKMPSLPRVSDLTDISDRKHKTEVTDSAALALNFNRIIGTDIFTYNDNIVEVDQDWLSPVSLWISLHLYVAATVAMTSTCHSASGLLSLTATSLTATSLFSYKACWFVFGVLLPERLNRGFDNQSQRDKGVLDLYLRQMVKKPTTVKPDIAEAIRQNIKKNLLRDLERGTMLAKSDDFSLQTCQLHGREHTLLSMQSGSTISKLILLTLASLLDIRILDALGVAMGPYLLSIGPCLVLADLSSQSLISALLVRGQLRHRCWQTTTRGPKTLSRKNAASINWSQVSLMDPILSLMHKAANSREYTDDILELPFHGSCRRYRHFRNNPWHSLAIPPSRQSRLRCESWAYLTLRCRNPLTPVSLSSWKTLPTERTQSRKCRRRGATTPDSLPSAITLAEQQRFDPQRRFHESTVAPTALYQRLRCPTNLPSNRYEGIKPANILIPTPPQNVAENLH